eukprot:CAMPEP_0119005742 /NCGR_PEP_ID=MMETSP1176-20130426/1902_1 /TAXON_ID=265551 /ORGANISM="Synedropsis recta cf, Strain CCMP1620" /LENGTH=379 /DNA_ID=CAMNT_0006957583 /DNA_START=221 /DNA_END=1360 /DNA_ORIENTATION=-
MADLEAIHEHDKQTVTVVVTATNANANTTNANANTTNTNAAAPTTSTSTTATSQKYLEHSEIFQDLCYEAAQEDSMTTATTASTYMSSLSGCSDDSNLPTTQVVETTSSSSSQHKQHVHVHVHVRRHSSYDSRSRAIHREQHDQMKEHFATHDDEHHSRRSNFINHLLDFNLSISVMDVSMANVVVGGADMLGGDNNNNNNNNNDASTTAMMHISCPILSYMNDEEEDSVEMTHLKRPSMGTVEEDQESSWESLKDDTVYDNEHVSSSLKEETKQYIMELPPLDDLDDEPKMKSTRPKRRRHSYKVLEEKLMEGSPLDVLKAWNSMSLLPNTPTPTTTTTVATAPTQPQQPKSLEVNNDFGFQTREGPLATRAQVARGA